MAVVVLAAAVTAGVLLLGPGGAGTPSGAPSPSTSPSPTPVSEVGLSNLPILRARFCDWIGDSAVRQALGGAISEQSHYDSGDRVELAPGLTDVAHEYSCTFTGVSGAEARAWVFAPPVRTAAARAFVAQAAHDAGCRVLAGGPEYGAPHVTTVCRTRVDDRPGRLVRLAGLFGSSWFSCQVALPGGALAETRARAETWCEHVAVTLGARA